jgi:hypothetical protein
MQMLCSRSVVKGVSLHLGEPPPLRISPEASLGGRLDAGHRRSASFEKLSNESMSGSDRCAQLRARRAAVSLDGRPKDLTLHWTPYSRCRRVPDVGMRSLARSAERWTSVGTGPALNLYELSSVGRR